MNAPQISVGDATRVGDKLVNLLTGLGGPNDKMTGTVYSFVPLTRYDLEAAYRTDWIARKVVDIPAKDSTRAWRSWQTGKKEITALEAIENRFFVKAKVQEAMITARLYGGAAIIIGVGNDALDVPLDPESVQKDSMKFLHVVAQHEFTSTESDLDITSPYYGEPKFYERVAVQTETVGGRGVLRVHPSRVVRIIGSDIPNRALLGVGEAWGDSALQVVDEAVRAAGLLIGTMPTLIAEGKIDVLKFPKLNETLSTAVGTTRMKERLEFMNTAKSVHKMIIMDEQEEWQRIPVSVQGMSDLLQMYLLVASGAADIPATRMLGQAPVGMNATGESDIRNYYDRLSAEQSTRLSPALNRLDEVLIRVALGKRPDDLFYNWNSLWQLDDVQKAAIAKQKADTAKVDADSALVPTEALAKGRQNQLIEDGTYPGLEDAIAEAERNADLVPEPEIVGPLDPNAPADPAAPDPVDPNAPAKAGKVLRLPTPAQRKAALAAKQVAATADAILLKDTKPRPLYVRRDLLNAAEVAAWAKTQGFTSFVADPHVTILFSKQPVDWMKMGQDYWGGDKDGKLTIPPGGPRVIEPLGEKGAVVLHFSSSDLTYRHCRMIEEGASSDYSDYQPHLTLTYAGAPEDVSKIEPYRGALVFGPEVFEDIKPNAGDDVEESYLGDAYPEQMREPPGLKKKGRKFMAGGVRKRHAPQHPEIPGPASLGDQITEAVSKAMKDAAPVPPTINVPVKIVMPRKGKEITKVTKHDAAGRIVEFEREEEDDGGEPGTGA